MASVVDPARFNRIRFPVARSCCPAIICNTSVRLTAAATNTFLPRAFCLALSATMSDTPEQRDQAWNGSKTSQAATASHSHFAIDR